MVGSVVTLGLPVPSCEPVLGLVTQYSRLLRELRTTFIVAVITLLGGVGLGGCQPDAHTVRGALAIAARAAEAGDARALYQAIDRRSTDALGSIAMDRERAATLIRADYPQEAAPAALRALGDALDAKDGAELFARRCPASCVAAIGAQLGAPVAETPRGDEIEVRTARGATLRLHRGENGTFGIVWNTQSLFDERRRAARELIQIRDNAAVYRKRRALEKSSG
jgi:hypothetical protein